MTGYSTGTYPTAKSSHSLVLPKVRISGRYRQVRFPALAHVSVHFPIYAHAVLSRLAQNTHTYTEFAKRRVLP